VEVGDTGDELAEEITRLLLRERPLGADAVEQLAACGA
jgi:hypothetical protein